MLKYAFAFTISAAGAAFWTTNGSAGSCDDLTGTYICDKYCPAEGIGGHDKVVQNGEELQLYDGAGNFKGYISGARTLIVARIWKENPLRGTLNADCSEIIWSNGSIWMRKN
jgi:hypothetical protein